MIFCTLRCCPPRSNLKLRLRRPASTTMSSGFNSLSAFLGWRHCADNKTCCVEIKTPPHRYSPVDELTKATRKDQWLCAFSSSDMFGIKSSSFPQLLPGEISSGSLHCCLMTFKIPERPSFEDSSMQSFPFKLTNWSFGSCEKSFSLMYLILLPPVQIKIF